MKVHHPDFNEAHRIANHHLRRRWFETEVSLLVRKIKLRGEIYNALQEARRTPPDREPDSQRGAK